MLIDCESCSGRGLACGECVLTVLLGDPEVGPGAAPCDGAAVHLDVADRRALHTLAEAGLVPPLRHRAARAG